MSRSLLDYVVLGLKGMAMGAADVVPGVSGGTIAFISGIYEELLNAISSINFGTLKIIRKEGVKAAWKSINGNFLVTLFAGIGLSIASLAWIVEHLLESYPVLLWSFFFGLVLASVYLVGKEIKKWNIGAILGIVAGTVIAYVITILPAMENSAEHWYVFVSGMIAICAMILPGVSGSFILVLMGSYFTILGAVNDRDLVIVGIFAAGAIVGLLSFARLLKWMFKRFHDITIAVLSGFLIGSLNKIWPWKQALDGVVKHAGEVDEEIVVTAFENTLPGGYSAISEFEKLEMGLNIGDKDPQTMYAILAMTGGLAIIFILERIAAKKPAEKPAE